MVGVRRQHEVVQVERTPVDLADLDLREPAEVAGSPVPVDHIVPGPVVGPDDGLEGVHLSAHEIQPEAALLVEVDALENVGGIGRRDVCEWTRSIKFTLVNSLRQ